MILILLQPDSTATASSATAAIGTSLDVVQIVFYITVATVTILTYRRAKKTLLQPIRTEVFKNQIDVCADLLEHFTGKSEYELRKDWGIDKVLLMNVSQMYDDYASLFFDMEVDRDDRPYGSAVGARVSEEAMEKQFVLQDGHIKDNGGEQSTSKPDPRVRASIWSDKVFGMIHVSKTFVEKEKSLQEKISSPLIPAELADLVTDYIYIVNKNISKIEDVISQSAKEMPNKYSNLETLQKSTHHWIRRSYLKEFEDLKPKAEEIIAYLRDYFQTDELLEP